MSAHESPYQHHRREYTRGGLTEDTAGSDPIALFHRWMDEASSGGVAEPNAMTLATVGADLQPSSRVVLLKHADEEGFVFFTNYASRKGRDLAVHPRASLHFFWKELERQVLIEGEVTRVDREMSARYFSTRPRDSQLGAWASAQSSPVASRAELEERFAAAAARFGQGDVPLPEYWGGYRLRPARLEFWQGRPNRLHDRIEFVAGPSGWTRGRLSP